MNFLTLPDELLLTVFQFLPIDHLVQCPHICRRFRDFFQTNQARLTKNFGLQFRSCTVVFEFLPSNPKTSSFLFFDIVGVHPTTFKEPSSLSEIITRSQGPKGFLLKWNYSKNTAAAFYNPLETIFSLVNISKLQIRLRDDDWACGVPDGTGQLFLIFPKSVLSFKELDVNFKDPLMPWHKPLNISAYLPINLRRISIYNTQREQFPHVNLDDKVLCSFLQLETIDLPGISTNITDLGIFTIINQWLAGLRHVESYALLIVGTSKIQKAPLHPQCTALCDVVTGVHKMSYTRGSSEKLQLSMSATTDYNVITKLKLYTSI